jgi:sulfatase maturation enzyme AslB (radical SAM superfamily)
MFVVTLRCNQKCSYCHASSVDDVATTLFDMDSATAKRCVECVFMSPAQNIKIEFQGGEPLLNFEVIRTIVEYAEELNADYKKKVEFVICTNLTIINVYRYSIYLTLPPLAG